MKENAKVVRWIDGDRFLFNGFLLHVTANAVTLVACNHDKTTGAIKIPKIVTAIGRGAFNDCKGITSVTIPEGVTKIEEYAFGDCRGITSVNIPASVTDIDFSAFLGCPNVRIEIAKDNPAYCVVDDVVYSKDMTKFLFCPPWKEEVTIPASVAEIGNRSFEDSTSLTSVNIPASVTNCDFVSTFSDCPNARIEIAKDNPAYCVVDDVVYSKDMTKLLFCPPWKEEVIIPAGVTEIERFAFSDCTSLASITIPAGVTEIDTGAFSGCTSLASVIIPEGVTEIGEMAFGGCISLRSVTIPASVTEIEYCAFYGCTSLTSINIPSSVTEIGDSAFSNCTSLTSVTIPATVTEIGDDVFEDCNENLVVNYMGYRMNVDQFYKFFYAYQRKLLDIKLKEIEDKINKEYYEENE